MHLRNRRESKNSTAYNGTEWFNGERLDWFRRNYMCFSVNVISSFKETMPTNSQSNLIPRLCAKSCGRTVKDKEFIPKRW